MNGGIGGGFFLVKKLELDVREEQLIGFLLEFKVMVFFIGYFGGFIIFWFFGGGVYCQEFWR